ncbi:MAG: SDR family oxidoreductase [Pseudomonadota bacterium]
MLSGANLETSDAARARTGHAIITGGSSGIGLAVARRLAAEGRAITLIARDAARLAAAREALVPHTAAVATHACDVADRPALEAALSQAVARHGVPDRVITAAGVARPGLFETLTPEAHERTMAVNYFGTLWTIHAVAPAMRAAGRGRIMLVSSGAGLVGIYGYGSYAPSKFALRGLAEVLRAELKPDGVGVSILFPPDTDTPQLAAENRTKPAATRAITKTARIMTADAVAAAALRGLAREKFAITPGWEMAALHQFGGLLAPLIRWHFDRIVSRRG